jgi:transcription antitermination factor NusG
MTDTTPWHAVNVRPSCEQRSVNEFADNGIEAFAPTGVKVRRATRHAKRAVVEYPLLSRYVFARGAGIAQRARAIKPVIDLVRWADGRPGRISAREISRMQAITRQKRELFRPGDRVRVLAGALAGRSAVIKRIDGHRAQIRIEMLGAERIVPIPVTSLEVEDER